MQRWHIMSQPAWYDIAIELERRQREFEAQQEVQRQAEEEAAKAPKTTAGIFYQEIANRTSRDMPLNGPGIIAAAGGNPYESNSFAHDSVAALIKRGLMTGSIQDGRNE